MHNRTTILPQQGGDQRADGELCTEENTNLTLHGRVLCAHDTHGKRMLLPSAV